MESTREKILVVEGDAAGRETLLATLQDAGYEVTAYSTSREALDAIHQSATDVLILDAGLRSPNPRELLANIRGASATEGLRVILLVGPGAEDRAAGLDLLADDAVSRRWDPQELLARVRAQLRVRRADQQLRDKMRIADEGQQIAHTAFEALAVTEKMTSDAFTLDRRLKIGFAAVFVLAAGMALIYFLFARSAEKGILRANAIISRLEGGLMRQQDLIAEARKLRSDPAAAPVAPVTRDELKQQADDLKSKIAGAGANPAEVASLKKQLDDTNARLKHAEKEGPAGVGMISVDVQSVCLLHVAVAFRHSSGKRLRYGGINSKGDPIQDSEGNPILTLEGTGPEVKFDIFGTAFLAGPNGRVVTNRHVAEPWWKNDELKDITSQGFQPEISLIRAYFPGDARAFHAEIQDISKETDLATMRVDMQGLSRTILALDSGKTAASTGAPIVVMGYATGLAAILARTDEDTAEQILTRGGNDVSQILDELAHRSLIRPLITQGHIGDVLADKIVFDAQTTSGGSGGPLFNEHGKVIGVTVAVLKGFGGSNFGIPIRFSQPLLAPN
jgi:DNA-binding response OmpR family regulator/S1-C subfamily serine protease